MEPLGWPEWERVSEASRAATAGPAAGWISSRARRGHVARLRLAATYGKDADEAPGDARAAQAASGTGPRDPLAGRRARIGAQQLWQSTARGAPRARAGAATARELRLPAAHGFDGRAGHGARLDRCGSLRAPGGECASARGCRRLRMRAGGVRGRAPTGGSVRGLVRGAA